MREKPIYEGRIDGSLKEVQEVVDFFLFENFQLPGIDFRVEYENQKQVWVIYPPSESNQAAEKIINGFIEINTESITDDRPVHVRLVSCRQILDLLFFQLSQRIQAKFIIRDYPPDVLTTSWKELIAQGFISPLSTNMNDVLLDKIPNPKGKVGKYGTERKLTEEQVRDIVARCEGSRERGGTIEWYYNHLPPSIQSQFTLGTLKDWVKNPKFKKPKKLPRNLPH